MNPILQRNCEARLDDFCNQLMEEFHYNTPIKTGALVTSEQLGLPEHAIYGLYYGIYVEYKGKSRGWIARSLGELK